MFTERELRQKARGLHFLPAAPGMPAQALATAVSSTSLNTVAACFLSDPALAAAGFREARLQRRPGPLRHIEDVLLALDIEGLRRTLFNMVNSSVSSSPLEQSEGLREIRRHSLLCAICAERIATRTGLVDSMEAFTAGLLHDMGKLALSVFMPDAWSKLPSASHGSEASSIEAEVETIGISHTVAGRWLAQDWGFPEDLQVVIWAHHLPANALSEGRFPTALLDTTALANLLAHGLTYERSKTLRERADRLDLDEGFVCGIHQEAERVVKSREQSLHVDTGQGLFELRALREAGEYFAGRHRQLLEENAQLRFEAHWRRILTGMTAGADPAQSLDEIAARSCEALREAFSAPSGCCALWTAPNGGAAIYRAWHSVEGPVVGPEEAERSTALTLLKGDAGPESSLDMLIGCMQAAGAPSSVLPGPASVQGLMTAPIRDGERAWGFIAVQSSCSAFSTEQNEALSAFAQAVSVLVSRREREERRLSQLEQLGCTLRRQDAKRSAWIEAERLAAQRAVAIRANEVLSLPLHEAASQIDVFLSSEQKGDASGALGKVRENLAKGMQVLERLQSVCPDSPEMEPSLVNFALHRVVADTVNARQHVRIDLATHYGEGLPRVLLDRRRMEEALRNLVDNAIEAMGNEGGTLSVETVHEPDRNAVKITVADTGPGMPPEVKERLFDPFFTTKQSQGHLGLGLAIVRAVVETHRGTIEVESQPGRGARFAILLPSIDVKGATATTAMQKQPVNQDKMPAVLLVEEDEGLAEVLAQALRAQHYSVDTAALESEALRILRSRPIDLIVIDVETSENDGVAILRNLRQHAPATPVIAAKEWRAGEETEDALEIGTCTCIEKPIEINHLIEETEKALLASKKDDAAQQAGNG